MGDDEMDGEWEPPMIDNPEYKGKWVHPEIDNPEYEADDKLYSFADFGAIGFDLWQVKAGTIFDNVLITDSVEYAEEFGNETWGKTKDPEKKMQLREMRMRRVRMMKMRKRRMTPRQRRMSYRGWR